MGKFLSANVIIALLLYTVIGLLPPKDLPHDHVLLGPVTAEQLRAHLAAEAQASQIESGSPAPTASTNPAVTSSGGLILSVVPVGSALVSVLHFEVALQLALILLMPLILYSIRVGRVLAQALPLACPDPPPRSLPDPT